MYSYKDAEIITSSFFALLGHRSVYRESIAAHSASAGGVVGVGRGAVRRRFTLLALLSVR